MPDCTEFTTYDVVCDDGTRFPFATLDLTDIFMDVHELICDQVMFTHPRYGMAWEPDEWDWKEIEDLSIREESGWYDVLLGAPPVMRYSCPMCQETGEIDEHMLREITRYGY